MDKEKFDKWLKPWLRNRWSKLVMKKGEGTSTYELTAKDIQTLINKTIKLLTKNT